MSGGEPPAKRRKSNFKEVLDAVPDELPAKHRKSTFKEVLDAVPDEETSPAAVIQRTCDIMERHLMHLSIFPMPSINIGVQVSPLREQAKLAVKALERLVAQIQHGNRRAAENFLLGDFRPRHPDDYAVLLYEWPRIKYRLREAVAAARAVCQDVDDCTDPIETYATTLDKFKLDPAKFTDKQRRNVFCVLVANAIAATQTHLLDKTHPMHDILASIVALVGKMERSTRSLKIFNPITGTSSDREYWAWIATLHTTAASLATEVMGKGGPPFTMMGLWHEQIPVDYRENC